MCKVRRCDGDGGASHTITSVPDGGGAMSQARRLTVPRVICASACAGALALTGCGGGSSFTSQANSICKTYSAKIKALPQPTSPADLAKFFDQFVPLAQQGTSK